MRFLATFCLCTVVIAAAIAADGRFENSTLALNFPSTVTLNESDFDYVPEVTYRFNIDGAPVLIGLQNDLQSNRQQLLDSTKDNVLRYLDNASTSTLSTYGSLQRCQGLNITGTSKHPKFTGQVTVYLVTFTNGNKTVLLIGISPTNDKRFSDALSTMSNSIKLKN